MYSNLLDSVYSKFKFELEDDAFPTTYIVHDNFDLLFIRFMEIQNNVLVFKAMSFLNIEGHYYLFDRPSSKFTLIHDGEDGILDSIKNKLRENNRILGQFVDIIEDLEDGIYSRDIPNNFMDSWFKLKKNLSKIERYYVRLNNVFQDVVDDKTGDDGQHRYQKLLSRFEMELSTSDLLIKKLDGIFTYHDLIKSDHLNRNIYLLTIISGIFLPLNLIVGFFGMNTTDMFFSNIPFGTAKVVWLLCIAAWISAFGIPIARKISAFFRAKKSIFNLGDYL